MAEISLLQENIFRLLKEGKEGEACAEDFFFTVMEDAAKKIGEKRNAQIDIDFRRTLEAHSDWLNDIKSLIRDKRIQNSDNPCHVKHAAFLCYWLRRRNVVRDIQGHGISDEHLRHYPGEFVAARIGMMLLFYRFLTSYAKWAFPVNVLAENKDRAAKHRWGLGALLTGLAAKTVDTIFQVACKDCEPLISLISLISSSNP